MDNYIINVWHEVRHCLDNVQKMPMETRRKHSLEFEKKLWAIQVSINRDTNELYLFHGDPDFKEMREEFKAKVRKYKEIVELVNKFREVGNVYAE